MRFTRLLAPLALTTVLTTAPLVSNADPVEDGRAAFVRNGCWQCHGFMGQGGAGPKLAPDPKPYDVISVFVRHTSGAMPKYSEKILTENDLASIYDYLRSIPKAADYKSIPLLN
jgi:ubiquinol-cytochrome c reductase cytochrome c subunit